jgi:hypothetical protein
VDLFKVLYVLTISVSLAAGYFLGKKYNPKPAEVVIEKITEQKTIEKEIKYDVVVEKEISTIPNFVRYKEEELDCSEVASIKLMLPRSRWPSATKVVSENLKLIEKAGHLFQESQFTITKVNLLKKIKCRLELNPDETQLLNELVKRRDYVEGLTY